MEQLGGQFELEPGNGGSREGYLADHKVETYLIVPPKVREEIIKLEIDLFWTIGKVSSYQILNFIFVI